VLILARELHERIIINPGSPDQVIVVVSDWRRDGRGRLCGVKLGFEAGQHIVIHREEIADRIASEQQTGGIR
jgi:carbon storage regulator CsrA